MISYYKIAKWIIGQDVEHSINSEDIKEIAKEEFGMSLTQTGVKKVKEELLKQGYNQKINDSINNFKPFKDIIRKYTTISNEMMSKQSKKDGFKYYLSLYVPMGTLSEELENELKAKASEMEGYEVKIVPEKWAGNPEYLRYKYGEDWKERAEDAIYIYHTVKKINDSINDLWKVSVEVHSGHSEFMTKEDFEKGNSIIDRFAELYGIKKQATFFKDFYIGSEPDVKLFADAIEKRLDDYLWVVGQPSQVTEKDREKLNIKDSIFTKEPLDYILEELDKEGIAYEVTEDEYGFDAPLYATITILDPNDSNLADEIICNQVGYAYAVVRDREGNKKAFKIATDPEDINSINNTGIKDSKFKDEIPEFTEKDKEAVRQWFLEVFEKVYTEAPLNISTLNILNNDDYFLGIFAGMYDILEDMRYNMVEEDDTKRAELKELYRRGKRLYNRYSMRKFKDSADWETLKKSKDFVLKRLFEELEQEKARPMSVEKENNIADIKSQIRKRAKEVRHVPNDIYDSKSNVGKKISWDRRALYGTILSENDPLTNKTTIEESSTGKVYFVSTRLLNKAIEKGEARLTDKKFEDAKAPISVQDIDEMPVGTIIWLESNDGRLHTLEQYKKVNNLEFRNEFEIGRTLKDHWYFGKEGTVFYQGPSMHSKESLKGRIIKNYKNNWYVGYECPDNIYEEISGRKLIRDANLTRKQKLWYAEELQKFIEPQYLRRNYQLRRLKNKRRRK